MSSWAATNLLRARSVERTLRTTLLDLTRITDTFPTISTQAQDFHMFGGAIPLRDELFEEVTLVADLIKLSADLAEHADSLSPGAAIALGDEIKKLLAKLGISLDDGIGAAGSAEEIRRDLEEQALGEDGWELDDQQIGDPEYDKWLIEVYWPSVVADATPEELEALWASLPLGIKRFFIDEAPETVINDIVGAGIPITQTEKDRLEDAIGFATDTETWAVDADGSFKIDKFVIGGGAGVSLVITTLSDGSVTITTVAETGVSVGVGGTSGQAGGSAAAILGLGANQVLKFEDDPDGSPTAAEKARAAADLLMDAATRDPDSPLPDGVVGDAIRIGIPGARGAEQIYDHIWGDEPSVLDVLDDLYDTNGESRSVSVEQGGRGSITYGDANIDVNATAEATGTVIVTTNKDGTESVSIVQAGSISGGGRVTLPDSPGSVVADTGGSFTHEVTVDSTGNATSTTTITVDVERGVGVSPLPPGVDGVEVHHDETVTAQATITVTIPINDETAGDAADVVTGLADGSLEIDDITTITDQATVNVTTTTGTNSTDSVSVDAGIFEVGAEETHGTTTTRTSHTSRPGDGGFQNDEDLNNALDGATIRPEAPSLRA